MTLVIDFQDCTLNIKNRVKNLLLTHGFELVWEMGKPNEKSITILSKFKYKEKKDEVD